MNILEKLTELKNLVEVKLGIVVAQAETGSKATLSDGTIVHWEGELAEGGMLHIETSEGMVPAPDREYEFDDGRIVTTKEGIIVSIMEVKEPTEVKMEAVAFDAVAFETELMGKVTEMIEAKFAEISAKFSEVESAVEAETTTNKAILEGITEIKVKFDEQPLEKPSTQQKQDFSAIPQAGKYAELIETIRNNKKTKIK